MTLSKIQSLIVSAFLSALASAAYSQQPPDTVASDGSQNTASGSSAMINIQTSMGATQSSAFGFNALLSDTVGYRNNAMGDHALESNTTGYGNSAFGYESLYLNTSGIHNTGAGNFTLQGNTTGSGNSAFGIYALFSNTTGSNTAVGYSALYYNTTGNSNDAVGNSALSVNTTGDFNAAVGDFALQANTTGNSNSATGVLALQANSTGSNNTAFGYQAAYSNTTGKGNAAQGVNALYNNTTGIRNLGIGSNALYSNTTGGYNIALGFDAGYNVTTGSNNIEIGAMGATADDNTIQIGVQGTQTITKIAGIYGVPITGAAVFVTAAGQLGVQASSERYKTEIATMTTASEKLGQLRPVTFHYKTDRKGVRQYGLIAEEVDRIYPELVIRDEAGKIQGVHYEELAPILLSEVQKQQKSIQAQQDLVRSLAKQNLLQAKQLLELKHQQQNQSAVQAAQIQDLRRQLTDLLADRRQPQKQLVANR